MENRIRTNDHNLAATPQNLTFSIPQIFHKNSECNAEQFPEMTAYFPALGTLGKGGLFVHRLTGLTGLSIQAGTDTTEILLQTWRNPSSYPIAPSQ